MEQIKKDKKLNVSLFALFIIISLFVVTKIVGEVKGGFGDDFSYSRITVSGKGEVVATSNIANLNIYLEKEDKTSVKAQELLNESIKEVVKYLEEENIESKDIKSTYGGIYPRYVYEKKAGCIGSYCPTERVLAGFVASQSIEVKIRDIDNANKIRTGLAEAGVDNVDGPNFSIEDEEGYKAEARALAIEDAKEKAKVLAKDLGVRLVKIVDFSEGGNMLYRYNEASYDSYDMGMKQMAVGSIAEEAPILPMGENKIHSNISLTYEIK